MLVVIEVVEIVNAYKDNDGVARAKKNGEGMLASVMQKSCESRGKILSLKNASTAESSCGRH